MGRLRRAMVPIVGLTAAGVVAGAVPAAAVPTIDHSQCEAGITQFYCDVYHSGGQGAVTIRWTRNGNPVPLWNDRYHVTGTCSRGELLNITVTVADSTGSVTEYPGDWCGGPYD